jgi:hypothetical protein
VLEARCPSREAAAKSVAFKTRSGLKRVSTGRAEARALAQGKLPVQPAKAAGMGVRCAAEAILPKNRRVSRSSRPFT